MKVRFFKMGFPELIARNMITFIGGCVFGACVVVLSSIEELQPFSFPARGSPHYVFNITVLCVGLVVGLFLFFKSILTRVDYIKGKTKKPINKKPKQDIVDKAGVLDVGEEL